MADVLCVEDDNLLSKELTRAFAEQSLTCDVARTIEQAQKALHSEEMPKIIFLDVMLGAESGLTFLKEVKADAAFRGIKVVMLTNSGPIADINRAMEMGASDYIVKANTDLEKIIEIAKQALAGL